MRAKFYEVLDRTLSEILRRDETYISRFPLGIADSSAVAAEYAARPEYACLAANLERALAEGFAYLARSWPAGQAPADPADPLTGFLCAGIVDACLAEQGGLPLDAVPVSERTAPESLASDFTLRQLPDGHRYFIRNRGDRPLVLINAAGVPIEIWRRLFADMSGDFKIVVAERASGDLFAGGLERNIGISEEADILSPIFEREALQEAILLAWCNGARVAVELARRSSNRISSLVLVAPTLRSRVKAVRPNLCPFEIGLHPVLEAVAERPELAPMLAHAISQQTQAVDWNALAANAKRRAENLFRLPPKDIAPGLMAPLASGASLSILARQVPADETYPIMDSLTQLRARVLLILGSHDHIVSNAYTTALIRQSGLSTVETALSGCGHYIHDLQYPYFRMLLREFLARRDVPPSARISPYMRDAKSSPASARDLDPAAGSSIAR